MNDEHDEYHRNLLDRIPSLPPKSWSTEHFDIFWDYLETPTEDREVLRIKSQSKNKKYCF